VRARKLLRSSLLHRDCFHWIIPKSIAARWAVQSAPSDPTVYPGSAWIQRGQRISNWWNERSSSKTSSTNDNWPISTPTLNITSVTGISAAGTPRALSPLAKPKPCNSPKAKATTHGCRIVRLVSPRQQRTISGPRKRMLRAISRCVPPQALRACQQVL